MTMEKKHLANVMIEQFTKAVENGVDLIAVVADSTSTSKISPFMSRYPERVVNVGIAEQALVSTAAGLALGGKVVVTCNAAPFLVSRANEQIKIDVCYNDTNVKMFGLNSGASYGPLASTHHSIDDISVMRGFGRLEIFAPSDPIECEQIIQYAINKVGPVYIRMDGKPLPVTHDEGYRFEPGKVDVLKRGENVSLVALGSTVHEVYEASERLLSEGISANVISLSSIRPLNKAELIEAVGQTPFVISVEEHNVNGGVGALVSEVMAEQGSGTRLIRLGINDGEYAIAANREDMRAHHGIDANSIYNLVKNLMDS
ncbi:putative transketolase, C-terminal section [Vibrio nigripulchritudo SFn118]|nr:putative transketolase, C-terminal section [Vibrio nigripulchritudo SFn118]